LCDPFSYHLVSQVEAPGEAEAQCAAMCKAGLVYAVATEDMDALTFGAPVLVRHMTFSEARKEPIIEFTLKTVLEELGLSQEEFTDLCILCGCDYTNTIRGIGPHRALELIKKHKSIEEVLKHIDTEKHPVPEDFLYKESAAAFANPDIKEAAEIKLEWKEPDEAGLIKFLVEDKGFNMDRVVSGIKKLKEAKGKSSQTRLESFFGAATHIKRKAKEEPEDKKGKKGKPAAKPAAMMKKK
jgi:flap endonuclease-1